MRGRFFERACGRADLRICVRRDTAPPSKEEEPPARFPFENKSTGRQVSSEWGRVVECVHFCGSVMFQKDKKDPVPFCGRVLVVTRRRPRSPGDEPLGLRRREDARKDDDRTRTETPEEVPDRYQSSFGAVREKHLHGDAAEVFDVSRARDVPPGRRGEPALNPACPSGGFNRGRRPCATRAWARSACAA